MRKRVLVTNDDGITAPGIRWLARAAVEQGLDVVVAAPSEDASGTSAAMNAVEQGGHVVVEEHTLPELVGVPAYGVSGSPGFIALIGLHGAFGSPPDMVLSGINRGANAGRAVLHSGTVGAAFTAAANGCPAIAVSMDIRSATVTQGTTRSREATLSASVRESGQEQHWSTAARVALDLLPRLAHVPSGSVLNVNAPNVPYEELRGVRQGGLATFGQVQMTVAETGRGFVRTSLEQTGAAVEPGTDISWLVAGYASVTAIRAVTEVPEVDLSDLG